MLAICLMWLVRKEKLVLYKRLDGIYAGLITYFDEFVGENNLPEKLLSKNNPVFSFKYFLAFPPLLID